MRRRFLTFVSIAGLIGSMLIVASSALAAGNPSANLDQCANGQAPSSPTDGCDANASDWVNGNLGPSKSTYREGDSIPYRMRFLNLTTSGAGAAYKLVIEWDTTKSGKHAIDYLTTWDQTVAGSNPCLGVGSTFCSGAKVDASAAAIPKDPQVDPGTPSGTGAIGGQLAGNFYMWGATITGVGFNPPPLYQYPNGSGFAADKSARIEIRFTATQSNPVLAWGGHIATRLDWGANSSAVSISGSPFHMRLVSLNGSGGNQDRSLSNDAVTFPGSITIIKDASPEGPTSFPFSASPSPLTNFDLVDDNTSTNTKVFSITDAADFKTYTVTENTPGGWDFMGVTCSVSSSNGGSAAINGATVTFDLREGESRACTYSNRKQTPSATISKVVTGLKNPDNTTDSDGKVDQAGDVISYSITYTNNGNQTLTGVTVADPLLGTLSCKIDGVAATSPFTLAPTKAVVCTGTYAATQNDIDTNGGGDGDIDNTATGDSNQTDPISDSKAVLIAQSPELNIVKSVKDVDGDTTDPVVDAVGDKIHYTITVANTGNVTLTGVSVTDLLADTGSIVRGADVVGDNDTLLEVGETWSYSATHTVTQAELDAGGNYDTSVPPDGLNDVLKNVATADSNESEPDTDDATAPVVAQPGITTLDKVVPQDSITLSNLTTGATGTLYVELQIDHDCGSTTPGPVYTKSWSGAAFIGNGTYTTTNAYAVSTDATIRWCVSYTGDAHNAPIALSDHDEVAVIDFNPLGSAAIGSGLTFLAWALWSRRRRDRED
jgi:uncharacterized repeat protein (TIGR01451 family)